MRLTCAALLIASVLGLGMDAGSATANRIVHGQGGYVPGIGFIPHGCVSMRTRSEGHRPHHRCRDLPRGLDRTAGVAGWELGAGEGDEEMMLTMDLGTSSRLLHRRLRRGGHVGCACGEFSPDLVAFPSRG